MNRYFNWILIVMVVAFQSCDWSTKPYIQHELEYRKIGDACRTTEGFKMTSNTNGERYELDECLDIDFSKEKLIVERKTDTVVIRFKDEGKAKAMFSLTIDIDTYPRYNFLTIGPDTYRIVQGKY